MVTTQLPSIVAYMSALISWLVDWIRIHKRREANVRSYDEKMVLYELALQSDLDYGIV